LGQHQEALQPALADSYLTSVLVVCGNERPHVASIFSNIYRFVTMVY
jgi:hypothetical protein